MSTDSFSICFYTFFCPYIRTTFLFDFINFFGFYQQQHRTAQFVFHSRNAHHFRGRLRLLHSLQFKAVVQ